MCEFIDNIIKKCENINIITTLNENKLYQISISDNYDKGFEYINEKGANNPLNMGHIRNGQDNDDETSEFGIGMKAAAIAAGNKFTIYTKVDDKYYKIYFDFIKMSLEKDTDKSYSPLINIITQDEYTINHDFDSGSTLILDDIRGEIYSATSVESITNDIKNQLSSIYGKLIKKYNVKITINDDIIEPEYDFFKDEKCKIFTQSAKLYYLEQEKSKIKIFLIEYPNNKYYLYKDNKINKDKDNLNHYLEHDYLCKYQMDKDKKHSLEID